MNFKTKSIVSAFVIYTICALSSLIFFLIGNQGNGDSKFLPWANYDYLLSSNSSNYNYTPTFTLKA